MQNSIKGKLVTIRPPLKSDGEDIYANVSSRDIPRNTFVPWPYTLKHADEFVKLSKTSWRINKAYSFAVVPHDVGRVVGMVSLQNVRHSHRCIGLGYWMGKKYRGKGYTSEAIRLVLRFAFHKLKFQRVQATTLLDNKISQKVLEKCGFQYEGTLHKYLLHRGRFKDVRIYSILKNEFKLENGY